MKINPIGATMFLLSAVAIGRNTVTGFSLSNTPTSLTKRVYRTSVVLQQQKGQKQQQGGGKNIIPKHEWKMTMKNLSSVLLYIPLLYTFYNLHYFYLYHSCNNNNKQ
jgi:hypothetical protein